MDEDGLADWARRLRARLPAKDVSLGLVFMSPKFFPHATAVLEILQLSACADTAAGGLFFRAGGRGGGLGRDPEQSRRAGWCWRFTSPPGAKQLKAVRFTQGACIDRAEDENFWPEETHRGGWPAADDVNGWLAFIDPFHLDAEAWLRSWHKNYPGQPVYGGLASGSFPEPVTQIYLDGEVYDDGGVAIAIGGDVALSGVVAQGCTPIGEAWTLTRVEQNLIQHIGNRPAYSVLAETVNQLPPADQQKVRGNLFIGLAG